MKVSLRTKVVAAVLLMAVMVAGVTGTMGYRTYARSMEEHYERLTMNTAKSAASMVDAGTVADPHPDGAWYSDHYAVWADLQF